MDFRKTIDGLAALVELDIKVAVFGSMLFVFLNRYHDRVNIGTDVELVDYHQTEIPHGLLDAGETWVLEDLAIWLQSTTYRSHHSDYDGHSGLFAK